MTRTNPTSVNDLSRAGDIIAEILGNVLVQSQEDELTEAVADAAKDAIMQWHLLRTRS